MLDPAAQDSDGAEMGAQVGVDERALLTVDTAPLPGTPDAPDVLAAFVRHLRLERGLSEHTIRAYTADIGSLLHHADRMGRPRPGDLDIGILRSWLAKLTTTGKARTTIARHAASARVFTAFCARRGWLTPDPGLILATPKAQRLLPGVLGKSLHAAAAM